MKSKLVTSAALAAILLVSGAAMVPQPGSSSAQAAEEGVRAPEFAPWGFDLTGIDRKAAPGDSFYDYADGAWDARTVIPPDKSRYGVFDMLRDRSQEHVRGIIEEAAKSGAAADTDAGKIGALYNSFMDEARIERLDASPIAADLARIRETRTKPDMAALMGSSKTGFGVSLFSVGVSEDAKDPMHHTLSASQSGLGLPDRDYYLRDTFNDKKAKYRDYIAHMLEMVSWPD